MTYNKYSTETKAYMKGIEEYLTKRFGTVQEEWKLSLKLLADNVELYKQCKDSIEENGIFDPNTGKKNPLLITIKDLQTQINKLVKELGLSPHAAGMIKSTSEDDSEILKNIMGVGEDNE